MVGRSYARGRWAPPGPAQKHRPVWPGLAGPAGPPGNDPSPCPRKPQPIARRHPLSMSDDYQIGAIVRDIRVSRGLRQADVAERAGVSRPTISRLERGLVDGMTVGALRAISRALDMPSIVSLGWRSPEIDRLRDRLHAGKVDQMVSILKGAGWEARPEYSFNHFGERGSVDILAWHVASRTLLIVEVKTRLWDIQELLSAMNKKERLVPRLVNRDFEWSAQVVASLLVLPEMSTHRHVVDRHAATFEAALPQRQWEVRGWLSHPSGALHGILFLPNAQHDYIGQRAGRRRASTLRRKTHRPHRVGEIGANHGPNVYLGA